MPFPEAFFPRQSRALRWALVVVSCLLAVQARAQQAAAGAPAASPGAIRSDEVCDGRDLIRTATLSGPSLRGSLGPIQDGRLATEGALWNSAAATRFGKRDAELLVDFGAVQSLRHFLLQGDDNDEYPIDGSLDGLTWQPIWTAPPASDEGQGLRTRSTTLPSAAKARYLRIQGARGDGYYSISELRVHCDKPKVWPPALIRAPKQYGWKAIDNDVMVQIKGWAAAFSTVVLLLWWFGRRSRKLRMTCDVLLATCGLFGFVSWWNLGHFHFDHYVHVWEHYHYYIGAKYGPELRYSRLYECTAAADLADGRLDRVKQRQIRDLAAGNLLVSTEAIIADPTRCTRHFEKERWEEFRKDIRFFRSHFSAERWDESQVDHGYNGTPVWAVTARLITDASDVTWQKIERIAWLDSILLVVMWLVSLWAFGWRATCVALLWWGFNYPARFFWNGGSFLRYDWLVFSVVGICLLRKQHSFGAGLALTFATLLRVFPGFIVAALVLKALARIVRERRLVVSRAHAAFAAGCVVAFAVLIPASGWAMGGLDAWPQFVKNSQKHLKTPLTNNMGLKTALGYDPRTSARKLHDESAAEPFARWKDVREHTYETRAPILLALIVLFAIMLARAGDREPDWVAACLGTGFIAISTELTCYYYGFLLGLGLLWERHKFPGIAATALAALTCWFHFKWGWYDDLFAAISLATSITVVLATAWVAFRPATREAEPTSEPAEAPNVPSPALSPPSAAS